MYDFEGVGRISPTTLRYVKVLSDLEYMFGVLDGMSVAEIGGGYGGQCALIKTRFEVLQYTLIDLSPVLGLAQQYLEHLRIADVIFRPWDQLEDIQCSLAISNYALSEMRRDVQEFYIERVLSRAERGYVLWNMNGREVGSMTGKEFSSASRAPNSSRRLLHC